MKAEANRTKDKMDELSEAAGDVSGGFSRLYDEARRAREAQEALAKSQDKGAERSKNLQDETNKLTAALRKMGLTAQWATLQAARANLNDARSRFITARSNARRADGLVLAPGIRRLAHEELVAADQHLRDTTEATLAAAKDVTDGLKGLGGANGNGSKTDKSDKKKPKGPSAEEIEERFKSELSRIGTERLQAEQAIATSAEERQRIADALLGEEYKQRVAEIKAAKDFSPQQRADLLKATNRLFGYDDNGDVRSDSPLYQAAAREFDKQTDEEKRIVADAQAGVERDILRASLDLADGRKERKAIELKLLDNAYETERRALQAQAADKTIDDAKREEARIRLERLDRLKDDDKASIERQYEGPLDEYLRSIPDSADKINDALENIAVGGLRDVEDGFARAATKALGLKGAIGSVVQELLKLAMKKYVIDALFGLLGLGKKTASSSSSGSDGARAFGGPVSAGRTYLVGENGPELLRMGSQAGVVIPNHQIAAQGRSTTIIQNFTLDARGGITTPQWLAQVNSTIAQAGTAAAMAGGMEGERRVARRANRQIPR
jgi:hypothetical protein